MVNKSQRSDRLDSLSGHFDLSMFPRTFRVSTNAPKINDDNIDSIHNCMKAMALKHPEKLLEQAKIILGGGPELLNSKFATLAASENKDEPVAAMTKENLQERRPALGRKRARFSMKPNSLQPSVSFEPTLDITQLQDPEEYFRAHEKLEKAKRELERQRGSVMTDSKEDSPSKTARRRRPGILGKTVNYKHHQYSSVLSNNEKTFMSSQDTLEQEILSPDVYRSMPVATGQNVELQESELAGSIAKTENRVNKLLDELLSTVNLDGDGALSFLQDRLQIKPIDLDKLCLPDLHDIGRTGFTSLGETLPKPRSTLSDIHNFGKGLSSRTPAKHKQVAESSIDSLASPTPPKSPFASISTLQKRILRSSLSKDPFSVLNVDLSPARDYSPTECESDRVDSRKESNVSERSRSVVIERDNITAGRMGNPEVVTGDPIYQFNQPVNDNTMFGIAIDVRSSGANDDLEFNTGSNCTHKSLVDEDVSRPNTDNDVPEKGSHEIGEHVEDMLQEAVLSSQPDNNIDDSTGPYANCETYKPNEMEENVEDVPLEAASSVLPDIDMEDSTVEKSNSTRLQLDESSHAAVEHHAMDVPSRIPDTALEQHTEEPSRKSPRGRNKVKRPSREEEKRKAVSRRRSLAEAGTSWKSGVRRSSRIKMRPLEYWKGERFLYGRVHESLTTVIGVKYVSPAKGEAKPTIRVKSYVSDEYKELVELAALH